MCDQFMIHNNFHCIQRDFLEIYLSNSVKFHHITWSIDFVRLFDFLFYTILFIIIYIVLPFILWFS